MTMRGDICGSVPRLAHCKHRQVSRVCGVRAGATTFTVGPPYSGRGHHIQDGATTFRVGPPHELLSLRTLFVVNLAVSSKRCYL